MPAGILEVSDARGRIDRVEQNLFGEFNIAQYSYDLANNVLTRELANGVTANLTDNPNNWVTSLNHTLGSTRIADFTYDYDKVGNRASEQKLPDSSPGQFQTANLNSIYQMIGFKSVTVLPTTKPATLVPPSYPDPNHLRSRRQLELQGYRRGDGESHPQHPEPNHLHQWRAASL